MIISASRRTDLPAFYGDWLLNRLKEGVVDRVNPVNPLQVSRLLFTPQTIDSIVFWTKNPSAFLVNLDEVLKMGYRGMFLFTLNSYTQEVEPGIGDLNSRIEAFKAVSKIVGKRAVAWRYDPVILSTSFTSEWHFEQIEKIYNKLSGYTNRLILSFYDYYSAPQKRMAGIDSLDMSGCCDHLKSQFMKRLSDMFREEEIEISLCAQKEDYSDCGIYNRGCIEGRDIADLFGLNIKAERDKGQRGSCLCTRSFDIGAYETCRYNCIYCYADKRRNRNKPHKYHHNPASISLIPYPRNAKITVKDLTSGLFC